MCSFQWLEIYKCFLAGVRVSQTFLEIKMFLSLQDPSVEDLELLRRLTQGQQRMDKVGGKSAS